MTGHTMGVSRSTGRGKRFAPDSVLFTRPSAPGTTEHARPGAWPGRFELRPGHWSSADPVRCALFPLVSFAG